MLKLVRIFVRELGGFLPGRFDGLFRPTHKPDASAYRLDLRSQEAKKRREQLSRRRIRSLDRHAKIVKTAPALPIVDRQAVVRAVRQLPETAESAKKTTIFATRRAITWVLIALLTFSSLLTYRFATKQDQKQPARAMSYQFTPTGGGITTGTPQAITSQTAAATNPPTNAGSWKGTLSNDNFYWAFASTSKGYSAYLDVGNAALNNANTLIVQAELDLNATAPSTLVQLCDWSSSTSVDNAADAQCTGGGWRTLNNRKAGITTVGSNAYDWQIYDGYWTNGSNVAVSTPLTNFLNGSNNMRLRFYSTTNTTSVVGIDWVRIFAETNPMYTVAGVTNLGSGAFTGDYSNTTSVTQGASDNIYWQVAGTAGSVADSYMSFKNVKTYSAMNSIVVRAESSCSIATAGLNYVFAVRNFTAGTWENLTSPIDCSTTDATNMFSKTITTLSDYISGGEIRIRLNGNINSTTGLRLDQIYLMVGSVNTSTGNCEISFGSQTAGRILDNPSSGSDQIVDMASDATYLYAVGYDSYGGNNGWRIEKRNKSDGSLDTGFGASGIISEHISVGGDQAFEVEVDANYVYIAGYDSTPGNNELRIEKRSISTGALVGAFGTSGVVTVNPSIRQDRINALAIDAGYIYTSSEDRTVSNTDSQWRIEKRDITTGALVGAFGTAGVVLSNPTAGLDNSNTIKVDSNYVYISGADSTNANRWRIEKRDKTTGATVAAFGTSGVVTEDVAAAGSDEIYTSVLTATDIYVAGYDSSPGNNQWRVERRNITTGALVSGFGTGGVVTVNPSANQDRVYRIAADSSNLYIVGEDRTNSATQARWRIEKRNILSGALVTSFDGDGVALAEDGGDDRPQAIVVDSSYIYPAGYGSGVGNNQWYFQKRDSTTGLRVTSGFGANDCAAASSIDTTSSASGWAIQTEDESSNRGTGEANSLYAYDMPSNSTVEEGAAANISFPVNLSNSSQGAGLYFAGRMTGGSGGTVQMGLRDYSGGNQVSGGWTQLGASATTSSVYTDPVTVGGIASGGVAGWVNQPEDYIDTIHDKVNVRLRTNTGGATATNSTYAWDFAFVSIAWIDAPTTPNRLSQWMPSSEDLVTGVDQPITTDLAANVEGINTGSWKGTIADDSYHWVVGSTTSGLDAQLNFDGVKLRGANKMIIETDVDLDATVPNLLLQVCDWNRTNGVDNPADSQCTGGGWRTINTRDQSNVPVPFTSTTHNSMQWHLYDGYFSSGATGGTPIATPLSDFISPSTLQVKLRYYSTTNTTSTVAIDFARIQFVVDPIYNPSSFANIGTGAVTGHYDQSAVGNTAAGQMAVANGDSLYLSVAGTASSVADFELSFKGLRTYTGANTILIASRYSCSIASNTHRPRIWNYTLGAWENLTTAALACSTTNAVNEWAKSNVNLSDYISNGAAKIDWQTLANGTQAIRVDYIYAMIGSVNNDTSQCEISMGTGTATNCSATRDLDTTGTLTGFQNPSEAESTSMSHDYYAFDTDADAVSERAASSNVSMPVTVPANASVTAVHYAARFSAGANGTVALGVRDWSGIYQTTGGWTAIGASATTTQVYTDSVTNLAANQFGLKGNSEDYTNTGNNLLNLRLRTSADSTIASTASWDFAMVSLQWTETVFPTYTQANYRWFSNANSANVGSVLAAQNTAATAPSAGTPFRLRQNIGMTGQPLAQASEHYKLQIAPKVTACSNSLSYTDVTDSSGVITYYDNSNVATESALTANVNDPTDAGGVSPQSYQESRPFTNYVSEIPAGQAGLWDFSLVTNGAPPATTYCFRMIKADGSLFSTYNQFAEITTATNIAPNVASSLAQTTTANAAVTTGSWISDTSMKFTATVSDVDYSSSLQLCIEAKPIGTNFTNIENSCGSSVSNTGTPVAATHTLALGNDQDYHWQARVKDSDGAYSAWVSYGGNAESARDFGLDTTSPSGGTVFDGTTAGVDSLFNNGSLSTLSANWSGISSVASGLSGYEYSIGSSPGAIDVLGWTNNGTTASMTASSLTLRTTQIYYVNVRTTDNAGNTSIISSDGQVVQPSITFSISTSTLNFNNLNSSNGFTDTAATTLATTTNAFGGYIVRAYATQLLMAVGGIKTIPAFAGGSYLSPAGWSGTGFGYTSNDTSIQGLGLFPASGSCIGGGSAPCYAPFTLSSPGDIIADHTTNVSGSSIINEQFIVTAKVATTLAQDASRYATTIVYSAIPVY